MAVPLKVLVADDDPVTRLMVVRSLASVTGAVLQAANGLEALFVVERDDPDLLITDVQMPVLSGFDLIDALRRVDSSRALPVILLSSLKDRSAILRLKEAGISKYLLKPVRPDDLVERVKEVAAASQGWRAQRPRRASTSVLVVVPDHVLRSRIRSALEPQWRVGEAASAAEAGVRLLARVETPDLVLVAEGMAPFSEGQLADLVRTASAAARVMPPPVWLLSPSGEVPEGLRGVIVGAIATTDAAAIAASVSGLLSAFASRVRPSGPTPAAGSRAVDGAKPLVVAG